MDFRISSSGIVRETRTAARPSWAIPLHAPDHCVWKPAHHPVLKLRLPLAHTHVPPPLQTVLCGHLLHLHHHPKDAVEYPDSEQHHNLCKLHHPDVLFHYLFRVGHPSSRSDAL